MNSAIITIGDEILIGQTIDTNSAWLGRKLNEIGLDLIETRSIKDDAEAITSTLDSLFSKADLIIMTGGLGPTKDDITKRTLAAYFDSILETDQEVLERIRKYFEGRKMKMLEAHHDQALLPDKAQKLINNFGSASGMWFEKEGKVLISLPGVPYEVKGIMREFGLEKLRKHFDLPLIYHRTLLTWGRGESFIAKKIESWEKKAYEKGLKVAFLPSVGLVKIRVSGQNGSTSSKDLIDAMAEELYDLIPEYIYGENHDSLEKRVGEELVKRNKTLATAESCSGGYIAHLITKVPGSSAYFKGSLVAYSNEIKENILKVNTKDIEAHGAVSETVVRQMAENCRDIFQTDYAIATSGIAGPDGGSEEKPVGTIWIAIASESQTYTKLLSLGSRRLNNIYTTSIVCLGRLLKEIVN